MLKKYSFFFFIIFPLIILWLGSVYYFETLRLFTLLLPWVLTFNFTKKAAHRNNAITVFVIVWLLLFQYESARGFLLNPLANSLLNVNLPKIKFLFPPAGWIMFYNLGDTTGYVEVYGVKDGNAQFIDPHDILRTRDIMYDNVHRNVLSTIADPALSKSFCRHLERVLPYFDKFVVTSVYHPSLTQEPFKRFQKVQYQCPP